MTTLHLMVGLPCSGKTTYARKLASDSDALLLSLDAWHIYRARAKKLGVRFKLHYMDVPREELYRRLEARNRKLPDGTFTIPKKEMDRYITLFQPPEPDELLE